jgi:hypothetical protein
MYKVIDVVPFDTYKQNVPLFDLDECWVGILILVYSM